MASLSDDEIRSICEAEISASSGFTSGELSDERAKAMDYYLGEPYGDEVDGRSQIITREVLDTVEWVMPSLMRIYADAQNLAQFDPVGPEDEKAAEQETDRINYEFWKRNRGMYNLYTFCKDALLSKTGILKYYVDSGREEREEFKGLNDIELMQLMEDQAVQRELIEHEMGEDGHHAVFKVMVPPRIKIEPCPPEEVGVNMDARSPYIQDCRFVFHRTRKSKGELISEGYDRKLVESLPTNDEVDTQERLARRHLSDESDSNTSFHPAMAQYWITECYVRVDRDDDGIEELLKVTLASGSTSGAGSRLLDVEEADCIPFVSATPNILTHKFHGLSVADLTMDLQRIKSTILRQVLDATYLSNNPRALVNEDNVNLDDYLTSRPGGAVRFKGGAPGDVYSPIPSQPIPAETFGLLEYLDEVRKQRTGVGDEVAALDKTSLANVNTGVFALAYESARSKIELIARIIAEVGLVPLFKGLHTLMSKHIDREEVVRLRGKWVPVNPSKWRAREDMTVMIGLGQSSRERRMMGLEKIQQMQITAIEGGGMGALLLPQHVYKATADYTELWGLEPDLYWMDPAQAPLQAPKEPDAQQQLMQAQAQALMMDAQAKADKNQLEAFKVQAEARLKEREFEIRAAEAEAKNQLEMLKAQQVALKSDMETAGKVASIQAEQEKREVESRIKEVQMSLEHTKAERDREVNVYQIQMEAYHKQLQAHGIVGESEEQRSEREQAENQAKAEKMSERQMNEQIAQSVNRVMQILEAQEQDRSKPKAVVRDASGRAVAVGDRPIVRDANGLIQSIG